MMARLGLRWRIWLALAMVTGLVLAGAAWIMAVQTLDHGAEQLANLVYATATSVDEQRFAPQPSAMLAARLAPAGVLIRAAAPIAQAPRAPVGIVVLSKLRHLRQSSAAVQFEIGPPTRLWIQSRYPPQRWIGVPMQPLGAPIARATLWILLLTGSVVLLAGTWLARTLSRPLEQLARRAPNLMAGDLDLSEFRHAPVEVRALATTLAAALEQAQSHHQDREQTLVGLSHDLRTPLARLRFAIEMGDHNEPLARARMQADIEEMDALIGAFLLMQREGRDEIETRFDLAGLLRELATTFRTRGVIELQGAESEVLLRGRRLALHRALSNLLQNALEHGSAPIQMRLDVASDRIQVEVLDGGIRAEPQQQKQGFGIGLGVARTVAGMHGGGLQLEFAADGSRAVLWLAACAA